MNLIKDKLIKIRKRQDKCLKDLKKLQDECEHTNVIIVHRGSTGHYDPTNNKYWIEHKCPDCDKFWTEEL